MQGAFCRTLQAYEFAKYGFTKVFLGGTEIYIFHGETFISGSGNRYPGYQTLLGNRTTEKDLATAGNGQIAGYYYIRVGV